MSERGSGNRGSFLQSKRILVTGSHGFVGRNFVRHFLESGCDVIAVDSLLAGSGAKRVKDWPINPYAMPGNFKENICDARTYFKENEDEHFDIAIHLAAVVGGRMTIEGNPLAVAEDLEIDSAFWKWVSTARPSHVISFSSSAAYPVSLQVEGQAEILLEESFLDFTKNLGMPDLTYGWAKMTNEYLGKVVAKQFGIKVASYRPFSGYGSDQDPSYPFRAICERAAARTVNAEGKFFVWGSGNQKRDFIHIDDVIRCVMTTYEKITDGSSINISTGILTSFKDLARMACNAANWNPEIVGLSDKPEGVFSRGGSTTLQKSLGFTPSISIDEGVIRCVNEINSLGKNK